MVRRATQRLAPAGVAPLQQRRDPQAQKIARMRRVSVGFVVDPLQTVRLRVAHKLGARHFEQRPQQRLGAEPAERRHCARAPDAGAPQEAQQDRFGLVVKMVRQRHGIGPHPCQCGATRIPRGSFQSLAAR